MATPSYRGDEIKLVTVVVVNEVPVGRLDNLKRFLSSQMFPQVFAIDFPVPRLLMKHQRDDITLTVCCLHLLLSNDPVNTHSQHASGASRC